MYSRHQRQSHDRYSESFKKNEKRYYGLTPNINLVGLVNEVCDCLGHGSNGTASNLILETLAKETQMGLYQDPTIWAGMGLAQFDKMPFYDTKDRAYTSDKAKIYEKFGINIDLVSWEELRYNPLLSVIFCRLKYRLVRDAIPDTLEGRAKYWKKWYNSELGKGTVVQYIKTAEEFKLA